ncbi:hypothetical protein [Swingsia samuiensis]|uniref:Uncharacterized protein n=1 Tax=Swingsia samuiensis TaxID=1293412 RepID=A0A4Y6UHC1_9PROT|nr:hypothetical protein [Swingsia samuiensis]QDH16973.1 hypothetical protein E3D00_04910 [Swingsia samuiensis]
MALYSLNHSGLSATTGLGKTGARLGYICWKRHNAVILGARHHGLPPFIITGPATRMLQAQEREHDLWPQGTPLPRTRKRKA